jgi:predicted nucleic-acid-binding Zn-ribbon protein
MKTENEMKERNKIAKCPKCRNEMKLDEVIFQDSWQDPAYVEEYFVCQNPDCGYVDLEDKLREVDAQ